MSCDSSWNAPFLVAAVCLRRELDDSMQGDFDVWQVGLGKVMEIGVACNEVRTTVYNTEPK